MSIDLIFDAPLRTFDKICSQIIRCLNGHGRRAGLSQYHGFSVLDEHWGPSQVRVSVEDLRILTPGVVRDLRQIVARFPRWEIVVVIAVREKLGEWPNMGLYIREHEIIDGLQRDYFPMEFQRLVFEGAIPGGEYD